jgi:RNA polymerase sigma factor (sigma-70 family)
MTKDENDLWKRCRRGDREAREALILRYKSTLVKFWVRKIRVSAAWADWKDLMQEGMIGLMKAVDRFEPERGYEFSTFARPYVFGAIFDSPELTRGLTRRLEEIGRKVRSAHDKLMTKLERKPTVEEIAEEVGLTVIQVENAIQAKAIAFVAAIGDPDSDDPVESAPKADIHDSTENQERSVIIRDALSRLKERDALIITLHYIVGESDAEIALKTGLTEDAVKKARQRAMNELRRLLGVKKGSRHNEAR